MTANPPEPIIRQAPSSDELLYIPRRRLVHIQDGDWERWLRTISTIPAHESQFRDTAFAAIGISVPSLLTAIAQGLSSAWSPTWTLFIYLVCGIGSLVAAGACLAFDRKQGSAVRSSVAQVIQDMTEVRGRAAVSEEQVRSTAALPTIG